MPNSLLEVEVAWQMIQEQLKSNDSESIALSEAVGRTLSSAVVSDINSPPFDKSLVDGFAIANWFENGEPYSVIETVTAGMVPENSLEGSFATRIMTGCPLPKGASGVVMVEESEEISEGKIKFSSAQFREGQNILPEAKVIQKGQSLISSGERIEAHHVGALAEFGLTNLDVFRKSRVSVLTTGDELVDPDQVPGPGQIRNSNASMLMALAEAAGGEAENLGIGRDNLDSLNEKIAKGLESDVLVIAGGVSAGVLDLIPQCLANNGVEQVFHKINLKPGKPLWFGKSRTGCLVFGLPGNPVSSLVCFKLFAEPAIRRLENPDSEWMKSRSGELAEAFEVKGGRRTFWPVTVDQENQVPSVKPLSWKGSADQVTFVQANGLVDLKGQNGLLEKGTPVSFIEF